MIEKICELGVSYKINIIFSMFKWMKWIIKFQK